jgi:serine/threonine-protein kinase
MLYQLLTGRLPFADAAGSRHALEEAVLRAEPPLPSSIRRELRGDLDAIVRRAMHKEPARRYPSAAALADDLRRVRSGHPVLARPDSPGYRVRKFVGRNRVAAAAAALTVTALLGATAFSLRQMREAERQRDFALVQLSRAEAMSELNGFVLTDAAPSGKPFTVGDLLARAAKLVDRDHAESDVNRVEMLVSLGRQHASLGEEADARRILQRAYEIAQRLPGGPARGKAACALASELGPAGDSEGGEQLIQEGLAQIPSDFRYASDRIFCLLRGSYLARKSGRGPLGVARADSARTLLDAAPLASPTLRLRILMDLAESYREVAAIPRADTMFQAAYAQLALLGRENTQTAGTLLNNWALALRVLGQPRRSEQLLREALRISSADSAESGVSPMLLNNYGGALYALGRMPEALRYAQRAYALAEARGHQVVMNQALLLQVETYRELGDWTAAERKLAEVEPRLRRALPPGHFVFAVLTQHHALVAAARGHLDSAAALADEAVAMAEKARAPDDLLVLLYRRRSDIAGRRGQGAQAVQDAERALELTRAHQHKGQASSILGAVHLGLGRALMHNGELQRARTELDSASALLLATLGPDHPQMREVTALRDSLRIGAR